MDTQPNATDHTLGSKFKVQRYKEKMLEREGGGMFAGLQSTPVVLMLHTLIRLGIDLYHILGQLLNEAIWIID